LKEGNKVGIVSTARKLTAGEIQPCIDTLQSWGLEVALGNNLFKSDHQYSGTDKERADDLQQMLNDNSVQAILGARGGYGTVRLLDKLDFSTFETNPKWIIGFSDITVLHSYIHANLQIETIHGPMAIHFKDNNESIKQLKAALFGEQIDYQIDGHILNKEGAATGELVGGNLSIIYSMQGSKSAIDTFGKILFLEDLDEYLYHVDRMMMNLKRSGMLSELTGLIIGGMTEMNDNDVPFGVNAEEIIADSVTEYSYPVCFGFPAGHIKNNQPLILGRTASLKVVSDGVLLNYLNK